VNFSNAIFIGISQAIALLPGISRSGATISTSVLLGNDKTKAARFSFLMVVPLILGKIAKDVLSGDITYESANFTSLSAGFIAAFIAGLFACTWMIALVKKSKLSYFAMYCVVVGVTAIIFALLNR
jgi:undecaprenyl-diphosphatase